VTESSDFDFEREGRFVPELAALFAEPSPFLPPRDDDTYRLALESIQRWGGKYRVSPAMRLRAIRAVVDAALSGESGV